jgi:hypothetical protein
MALNNEKEPISDLTNVENTETAEEIVLVSPSKRLEKILLMSALSVS